MSSLHGSGLDPNGEETLMADDDITTGELGRRIDKLEHDMAGRIDKLERQVSHGMDRINGSLENLQFVPRDLYNVRHEALSKRVTAIEDKFVWFLRTLGAAIIVGIVTVLIGLYINGGGS
jgi:hypothetical protein